MKKISLFVLALSSGVVLLAQGTSKPTPMTVAPRFGIKAGANWSEFKTDGSSSSMPNTQTKAGFNGGFLYNIPISGMFRFQPELVYSQQGSRTSGSTTVTTNTTTTYNYTGDSKLGYINLPLLLQLQTAGGFFVETGPQLGYLLHSKSETTLNGTTTSSETMSGMRKLDWAWVGGIGFLSRSGLGIDARYNFGLRDINDDQNTSSNYQLKNRVIQAGLFWQFGAGK